MLASTLSQTRATSEGQSGTPKTHFITSERITKDQRVLKSCAEQEGKLHV